MQGTPRILNTRDDFERCHALAAAGCADAAAMRAHWQALIDSAYRYEFDRLLNANEQATGPEPDYYVMTLEDGTRRQERRVRMTNTRLDAFGYTKAAVVAKLAELEGR